MAARVIAVINQKGGTGKTTLAINLAGGLARRGRTVVVDADPQGSAAQWAGLGAEDGRSALEVRSTTSDIAGAVKELRGNADFLVVDCPPTLEGDVAGAAMESADTVLIPVLPSPMDLWGSVRLGDALAEARNRNSALAVYFVVNQAEPRSALSRAMQHALGEFDFPTLDARVHRRAIYRHAALEGCTVYDIGRRGETAVQEIDAILQEVLAS